MSSKKQIRLVLAGSKLTSQVPAGWFRRLFTGFNPKSNGYWDYAAHLDSNVYSIEQEIVATIEKLEGLLQKWRVEVDHNAQWYEQINTYGAHGIGPILEVEAKIFQKLTTDVAKPSADWRNFLNPRVIEKYGLSRKPSDGGGHSKQRQGHGVNRGSSLSDMDSSSGGFVKAHVVTSELTPAVKEAMGPLYDEVVATQSLDTKQGKQHGDGNSSNKHRNRRPDESREDFEKRRTAMQREGTW